MKKKQYKSQVDKTITWLDNIKEYLIVEGTAAEILKRLNKRFSINETTKTISTQLSIFIDMAMDFIMEFKKRFYEPKKENLPLEFNCFPSLNCYQLSYSKSEKMLKTVSKIFSNDV
jgi:hypothetical protein